MVELTFEQRTAMLENARLLADRRNDALAYVVICLELGLPYESTNRNLYDEGMAIILERDRKATEPVNSAEISTFGLRRLRRHEKRYDHNTPSERIGRMGYRD